jgi:hypothetical protein
LGATGRLDPQPGRPEAAAAIWAWRTPPAAAPSAPRRRLRGALQGAVALAVGAVLRALGWPTAGAVALALGSAVALSALLSPGFLYAGFERLFAATGRAVANALGALLLPLLFYGIFTPFALLFRRGRRDAMTRFYEPDAASYWSKRDRGRSASKSRARQY